MSVVSWFSDFGHLAANVAGALVIRRSVWISVRSLAMLPPAIRANPIGIQNREWPLIGSGYHRFLQAQYRAVDLSFAVSQLWREWKLARRFLFRCCV